MLINSNLENQEARSRFKTILIWILTILVSISIAIIIRVFFLDVYLIPSNSMEPVLIPGDIIFVSKMRYGARILKLRKFFNEKRIEFIRTRGWSSIKKGDVFVFNWPNYGATFDSTITYYGDRLVKRCYGLPGDSVVIKKGETKNERIKELINEGIKELNLFPHDSTLGWSLNNYGPLYVPAKGGQINLTKLNVCWYKDILLYENKNYRIKDSCLISSQGVRIPRYSFKYNYYFMLGDNFYNSEDSRYWGLVPEGNVIGKTVLVLFSQDPNGKALKKLRWNRVMKKI